MPTSANEIVARMRQALALSEPDLDTTVGTTVRKILDAVAEVVAESSVDTYLLDYQYDIETKIGADLDDFVSLFGFNRYQAKRATGVVVFERQTGATTTITIPFGTQVATEDPTPILVATMVPALLLAGQTSVSVPVQALIGGSQGNVAANSLRRRVTTLQGIGSFSNPAALTGGADQESDQQLRDRFKRTVFRNLAGTEHMFLAVALDNPNVTHANVIGAAKRFREQIELVSGAGTSTISNSKYVYPDSAVFGANIDGGEIASPGVQYAFDHETISVSSLSPIAVPDGVYDLEFAYVPLASRNDPINGITNRVDIYVNGNNPTEASETTVFRDTTLFTNTGNWLDINNFERLDGSQPAVNNYFVPFAFGPVTDPSIDGEITIGDNTLTEGADYWLVNDITATGGTPTSPSGIEIATASAAALDDGDIVTVNYVFNSVPRDVDRAIRVWRLITTDVQVHAAKPIYLDLHFAIMYASGFNVDSVQDEIEAALSEHIAGIGMNGVVQASDLLSVASQVPGVDAIRFAHSMDDTQGEAHYAIERVSSQGNRLSIYAKPVAYLRSGVTLTGAPTDVEIEGDGWDALEGWPDFGAIRIGSDTGTFGARTVNTGVPRLDDVTGISGTYAAGTAVHFVGYPSQPLDVIVGDDEYPVFNSATFIQKAQNTFHSFG